MKTVKIKVLDSLFLRFKMSMKLLFTGVIEWEEKNFYDELTKELLRSDTAIKVFKKRAVKIYKEMKKG